MFLCRPLRSLYDINRIRMAKNLPVRVRLNHEEQNLVTLLDCFTKQLRNEQPKLRTLELRFAGGWVRDKLLGLPSDDIDVATSCITGLEFAELLGKSGAGIEGSIAKISANPDQSKHLETAKAHIGKFEIDFVQLRSEEYAEDSRIPEVKFGTPTQDAERRDATLNAMFFNVHTQTIEDFTGKGLKDLEDGVIRTPIDPYKTFIDDPLRLLRCIRFAARFGFILDDSIFEAAKNEQVRTALREKVSKERVGAELQKTFKGPIPLYAIHLIRDLGINDVVFHIPPGEKVTAGSNFNNDSAQSIKIGKVLAGLLPCPKPQKCIEEEYVAVQPKAHESIATLQNQIDLNLPKIHSTISSYFENHQEIIYRLWLAACLNVFKDVQIEQKKMNIPAIKLIILESIKLGTADAIFVSNLSTYEKEIRSYLDIQDPVELGLMLRSLKTTGAPDWQVIVFWAMCMDLTKNLQDAESIVKRYSQFVDRLHQHKIPDRAFDKHRVDGHDVTNTLQVKGKIIALILDVIVRRQLEYPEESKEDMIEWLKQAWPELKAPLEEKAQEGVPVRSKNS